MRNSLLALSLLLAPVLLAQTADVRISQATPAFTPTLTGERFLLTLYWRNEGPDPATFVNVTVTGSPQPFFLLSAATTGWPCHPNPAGTSFRCQNAMLASGAEARVLLQMLTPPVPGTFTLRINVTAAEQDPNLANNTAELSLDIAAAPSTDLAISPASQLYRAESGDAMSIPIIVKNQGANDVSNVTAYFSIPVTEDMPEFSATGEDWSCAHPPFAAQAVICHRLSLDAGETAPITIHTDAPNDGSFTITGRLGGEGHSETSITNDLTTMTVTTDAAVVEEEPWTRVLVPIVSEGIPGTNNAEWHADVTGILLADSPFTIHPECVSPCNGSQPALRTPFDLLHSIYATDDSDPNQFLYVREADAHKVQLNARVYDANRTTETAGSELPIPRESDFTSEPMSLLGIPVAAHYRHTLRVYDLDGRIGGRVSIRIYANAETTPRLSTVGTLQASNPDRRAVDDLPAHPGLVQYELGQLLPLAGIDTLRVDIEPLDAGLKLWSFVSVTNNATHHVTTFSAQ